MGWSEGYAARTDYTFGYYRQLNPLYAAFAVTAAGFAAAPSGTACELGFGQGVSVAVHAASSDTHWWGTDFMPSHAEYAGQLAGPSGQATLLDESFAEFCARTDLPDFDFIGAHGIWSWVSPGNRRILADFLRRKLKPGGTFYVSYNTATGWASLLPLRHLLVRHTEVMSAAGHSRMDALGDALAFIRKVFDAKSVYAAQNPLAPAMLDKMEESRGAYMMHEYFGQHWDLMNVADVAEALAEAKLSLGCSARLIDHVPDLASFAEQRALLDAIPDAGFRETVRDVLLGERFRQDYWIKGPRRLSGPERAEALGRLRVVLVEPADLVEVTPMTPYGEVSLPRAAFDRTLEALDGHAPCSVGEVASRSGATLADTMSALLVLIHIGAVQPAQAEDESARAAPRAAAFNAGILDRARFGGALAYLANPVTAGAAHVPRLQQLLLLAEAAGHACPNAQAAFAHAILSGPSHDEGSPACMAGLQQDACSFAAGRRPVLRAMGVA